VGKFPGFCNQPGLDEIGLEFLALADTEAEALVSVSNAAVGVVLDVKEELVFNGNLTTSVF
jgi:hypothetical protein